MIIGLDVGGTNTDAVLLSSMGVEKQVKVPTDVSDLFNTVLSGLTELLKDISPDDIERIVLSTTLTTNAVVQKKVDPVGIIVSSGPGIDPEFFRTDDHYYPISGSIDHRGRERQPVNENEIISAGEKLADAGIDYIGVIGKFSTRNPSHEILIKEILKDKFKKIFMGHQVSGNLNFPRRIATTHLNAAVYSMHKKFFNAVEKSLKEKGLHVPIQILKADGGTMNLESSMEFPGQTILSGPAASVMGSIAYAPEKKDTVVLDIGGTTTDISIFINKVPLLEPVGIQRGKYKSLIRSLKTYSKGLGGDSSVKVVDGNLIIGPERKGPAMAFGGKVPTPTDAMVVLGIMDQGDKKMAMQGIDAIAKELGVSPMESAKNIFHQSCSMILTEAFEMVDRINHKPVYTVHEFLQGYKIKPEKILLLGGPARYCAEEIEDLSGIETQVVPCSSVANAIGAAAARTTCEVFLLVDTEQGFAVSPEENFKASVPKDYSEEDVRKTALSLLKTKAIESGSDPDNIEVETIEFQKFNIVRNFVPKGKIFKIKIQVMPGLISRFHNICGQSNGKDTIKGEKKK